MVGGGPSGVEFAAELHDFLKDDVTRLYPNIDPAQIKITLFDLLPHVLQMFDKSLIKYTEDTLRREGIALRTSTSVTEVRPKSMVVRNPDKSVEEIPYGTMVWVAGTMRRPLVAALGDQLEHKDRRGLEVTPHLMVAGASNIWGVGDCAVSGSPPTAQVANQEGRYLGGLLNGLADVDPAALKTPAAAGFAAKVGELDTFDYAHKGSFACKISRRRSPGTRISYLLAVNRSVCSDVICRDAGRSAQLQGDRNLT